jgi:hypothetical protein
VGQPEQKRTLKIEGAYFGEVMYDLIARRAAEKRFSLRLFDASDTKPDTTQVEILEAGSAEIVASVTNRILTDRCRIARDGRLLEAQPLEIARNRTYATDGKNAQDISYLDTSGGFSLMVKSRKSFPNVYNVTRAQVEVRWRRIPFEEFRLEDNRQKVVRHTQTGEQHEVVLEAGMPAKPADGTAAAPRRIASEYLGEDDYVKPQDAAIRKQAAEIAGDVKDRAEIVRKMLEWVNANVNADLIAETLTGPEVLAKRRGKCSEYAILFASLARAAGIPTRIARGVNYSGSLGWVGHMWDEVWLGEWMAVDATEGRFSAGPSHLKFVDSPTVDGTQGVRFKLVDNLEIEVLDFEERKTSPALKTGISGATYTNASFAFRISAPDNSWTLTETPGMISMTKGDADFTLVFFGVPAGTQPGPIMEIRLGAVTKMVPNYQLISRGTTDIEQHKAPSAIFSQTSKEGKTLINENILMIDGTSGYLFVWIVPQAQYVPLPGEFERILGSFEIVRDNGQ